MIPDKEQFARDTGALQRQARRDKMPRRSDSDPPDRKRRRQARVLIAGDDKFTANVAARLNDAGHATETSHSGSGTHQAFATNRPDLLILNLMLSDIPGVHLIEQLKDKGPLPPVIVVADQGDERAAVEFMRLGAEDYLIKDGEFMELLPMVVARALDRNRQVSKLALAERALTQQLALSTAILDTCGALIVVLDQTGNIVRFNPACERATGYGADETLGRPVWEMIVSDEDIESFQQMLAKLRAGQFPYEQIGRLKTRSGEERWISWSNTAIQNPAGKVDYIILTGIDLTDRKTLEKQSIRISEQERQRIGQDLHDGICQRLAGIEFMSQTLHSKLSERKVTEASNAKEISKLVRDTLHETRSLAHGLNPVEIKEEGLMLALENLCASAESMFRTKARLRCDGDVSVGDNLVALHYYRIAQEAVSNAIRHGKAKHIDVSLRRTDDRLTLSVVDDGIGIAGADRGNSGMGLKIMEYRASVIGASVSIQKKKPSGTRVTCSVRLRARTEQS